MASRAFLYILFFYFHLYIIHAHLPESSANFSTPLKFLDELNGVQKGNQREGVEKLKKHLAHLGYMLTCPRSFINNESKNTVDKCLEFAIKKYQKFYHLKITGVLDDATIKKMRKRRCGMPDFYPAKNNKTAFHKHYSFITGEPIHSKGTISYAFKNVKKELIPPMENAFRQWESVTHFKFTKATFYSGARLRISFKKEFQGEDAESLAYTLEDGRTHFNSAMRFSPTRVANAYDVGSVFLHEMGHALGLGHSEIEQASMYADFDEGEVRGLHQDDISGIKALYHL